MPAVSDSPTKRIPCAWCNDLDTKPRRRYFFEHPELGIWIKRQYLCNKCGRQFETAEVSLGVGLTVDGPQTLL